MVVWSQTMCASTTTPYGTRMALVYAPPQHRRPYPWSNDECNDIAQYPFSWIHQTWPSNNELKNNLILTKAHHIHIRFRGLAYVRAYSSIEPPRLPSAV